VRAVLSGVSRVAVMAALRAAGSPLPVTELAARVGLHANTVRWHLDGLSEAGWVDQVTQLQGRPGRPRLLYAARPMPVGLDDRLSGDAESPARGYRLLADILVGYLAETRPDPAAAAADAGRAWGGYLVGKSAPFRRLDPTEAVRRVVEMLDDLGFAPQPDAVGDGIALHACPFRDVAKAHPDVTCSVHLGLMQGALAELGLPGTAARLEPFAAPSLCRAHIVAEPVDCTAEGEAATRD
jgi:predicted ArsR family transcriptional regulator